MALSIALPLSGLEPELFSVLGTRILYDQGLRTLTGCGPISPSTSSESSGVGSFVPSIESTTPEQTPAHSRPETPVEAPKPEEKPEPPVRVYYRERDILNLGANIREPFWQMRVPMMPRYDFKSFMENRSVYYRLGEYGLTEEYPVRWAIRSDSEESQTMTTSKPCSLRILRARRSCKDCGFSEPSPYLF